MPDKFVNGESYYRCGFGVPESPIVSTWIYLGYEHTPGRSSNSCDQPEHFYAFEEYEHWESRQHRNGRKPMVLLIPSLKQAHESFLTWEEFLKEIDEFREEGAENVK